jgi:TP901-1 family phage major tail protein
MAFNQKTDLIKGEALMLYIGEVNGGTTTYKPIAYASSHTLSINGDTIDTSSKMSGAWKEFLIGQLNWQVTSESLVSKTSGHASFNTLKSLMIAREAIPIKIGHPLTSSADFELDASKGVLAGNAIITSLEQTATNGELCTSSITLQGTGALEDETPTT